MGDHTVPVSNNLALILRIDLVDIIMTFVFKGQLSVK